MDEFIKTRILVKALEKTIKNGYKNPIRSPINTSFIAFGLHYSIIFSHDFAKAFWGERKPLFNGDGVGERICLHCGVDTAYQPKRETGCNHVHYPEACTICSNKLKDWQYHLQQMVLEKEPLRYVERFI